MCENALRRAAEGEAVAESLLQFLVVIGMIEAPTSLTTLGHRYYEARFIRNDEAAMRLALHDALLLHPGVQAILQLLQGVQSANRANALAILKSRGMWSYKDERPLTNLLLAMNNAGLITYSKKHGSIRVLYNPAQQEQGVPSNIFIDPKHPYGNKVWMKRVLEECQGHIRWLDKHFVPIGLEYIWETADANRVRDIRILSLYLPNLIGKSAIKQYRDLKAELAAKGITFTWYVIDSKLIRDNHDRWILSANGAWNLPDLNTVQSGSRSEITKTTNGAAMETAFAAYIRQAQEITTISISASPAQAGSNHSL